MHLPRPPRYLPLPLPSTLLPPSLSLPRPSTSSSSQPVHLVLPFPCLATPSYPFTFFPSLASPFYYSVTFSFPSLPCPPTSSASPLSSRRPPSPSLPLPLPSTLPPPSLSLSCLPFYSLTFSFPYLTVLRLRLLPFPRFVQLVLPFPSLALPLPFQHYFPTIFPALHTRSQCVPYLFIQRGINCLPRLLLAQRN